MGHVYHLWAFTDLDSIVFIVGFTTSTQSKTHVNWHSFINPDMKSSFLNLHFFGHWFGYGAWKPGMPTAVDAMVNQGNRSCAATSQSCGLREIRQDA